MYVVHQGVPETLLFSFQKDDPVSIAAVSIITAITTDRFRRAADGSVLGFTTLVAAFDADPDPAAAADALAAVNVPSCIRAIAVNDDKLFVLVNANPTKAWDACPNAPDPSDFENGGQNIDLEALNADAAYALRRPSAALNETVKWDEDLPG